MLERYFLAIPLPVDRTLPFPVPFLLRADAIWANLMFLRDATICRAVFTVRAMCASYPDRDVSPGQTLGVSRPTSLRTPSALLTAVLALGQSAVSYFFAAFCFVRFFMRPRLMTRKCPTNIATVSWI